MSLQISVIETTPLGEQATVISVIEGFAVSAVTSVFGRTGDVVPNPTNISTPAGYDYTSEMIAHVPSGDITSDNVQDALDETMGVASTNAGNISDNADAITAIQEELDAADQISEPMSESVYQSLCDMQSKVKAASGNLEWGKHQVNAGVNQGIWQYVGAGSENEMYLGRTSAATPEGVSRTLHPVLNVDGSTVNLINAGNATDNQSTLKFPPAPNGAQSNELDYETEIDPKYGDVAADLSEAVARCFEGEVKNGDFRFGDDGSWDKFGDTVVIAGGEVSLGDGVDPVAQFIETNNSVDIPIIAGEEYEVECDIASLDTNVSIRVRASSGYQLQEGVGSTGVHKLTFTAVETGNFGFLLYVSGTQRATIKRASIRRKTNPVVLNRQDYWFTEVFDELIEDKDIFVPNAMTQWSLATWNGIALSTTHCPDEYASYFKGDTTKGYFAVWSTMTAADKANAWSDPNNHIRQLEDGRLVQRRVRIRTVAGKEGSWGNIDTLTTLALNFVGGSYPNPQGTNDAALPLSGIENDVYVSEGHTLYGSRELRTGTFTAVTSSGSDTGKAYNGFCVAVPGGLVTRYNQGAYHPAYNPMGASKFWTSTNGAIGDWYNTNVVGLVSSVADCFDFVSSAPTVTGAAAGGQYGGRIGTTYSGRPDSKFYDGIYASNVKDERLTAHIRPQVDVLEEFTRKMIAGEIRGWEKQPFTYIRKGVVDSGPGGVITLDDNSDMSEGESVWIEQSNGTYLKALVTDLGSVSIVIDITSDRFDGQHVVHHSWLDIPVQEHTWTDIIGDPARIAATFPDGVIGQWIPVIPPFNGEDCPLNRKYLSSWANNVLQTGDDGVTWSQLTYGVYPQTNTPTSGFGSSSYVGLMSYLTPSHYTTPSTTRGKSFVFGDVYVDAQYEVSSPTNLTSTLLGKVSTSDGLYGGELIPLSRKTEIIDSELRVTYNPMEHDQIELGPTTNDSPAVKVLSYLTHEDGRYKVNLIFKELVYDASKFSVWGDDSLMQIADNDNTIQNNHDVTVKYGTHTFDVPIVYPEWRET